MKKAEKVENSEDDLVTSVPAAGRMAGLGRNASYDAARRGDIPTIRFGKLIKVPLSIWRRKLGLMDSNRAVSE